MDKVLVMAAFNGDAGKVAVLLSLGARVDLRFQGFTPLLAAAHEGQTEVCEMLLDKGKAKIEEVGPDGSTALIMAAHKGHARTVALLLSKGARVDTGVQGISALMRAVEDGHVEVCKLLLKTGKANLKERRSSDGRGV